MQSKKKKPKIRILGEEKGVALIAVFLMSIVILLTMLTIMLHLSKSYKTTTMVAKGNKTLYLADSGIEAALAQLREDPNNLATINYYETAMGKYEVTLEEIAVAPARIVKATSIGTLEKRGDWDPPTRKIIAEIETDMPGDYFGASNGTLMIAGGTDISQGKIYAKDIIFQKSGGQIKVQAATYTNSCNYFDSDFDKTHVLVVDPNSGGKNEPWKGSKKTFPRLDSSKLEYYKNLASSGNGSGVIIKDTFKNATDIYPPTNGTHIYFCDDDIEIQGNIHGQIIFVSSGTITFTGNITYGTLTDTFGNPIPDPCTAAGFFSAEDVLIGKNAPDDLTINGQIIAPYGEFKAESNEGANNFTFNGNFMVEKGVNIAGVYKGIRTYVFDQNLKNYPLPHMPYMANIISWKEE